MDFLISGQEFLHCAFSVDLDAPASELLCQFRGNLRVLQWQQTLGEFHQRGIGVRARDDLDARAHARPAGDDGQRRHGSANVIEQKRVAN